MPPRKRVLHVGSGPKIRAGSGQPPKLHESFCTPDWEEVRLDINPKVEPDIVASITNLSIIPDGLFDALYSSHNLEHLHPHEVPVALGEFYRVLRPSGYALITLPDLTQVARAIVAGGEEAPVLMTDKGPITPLDILYGFRPFLAAGNLFMAHNFAFTAQTLRQALEQAGFSTVTVEPDDVYNLWAVAGK